PREDPTMRSLCEKTLDHLRQFLGAREAIRHISLDLRIQKMPRGHRKDDVGSFTAPAAFEIVSALFVVVVQSQHRMITGDPFGVPGRFGDAPLVLTYYLRRTGQ